MYFTKFGNAKWKQVVGAHVNISNSCLSLWDVTGIPSRLAGHESKVLKSSPYLFNTLTFGHILVANFHSRMQQTLNQIRGVDSHQVSSFVSTWSRETRFQLASNFYMETCPAKKKKIKYIHLKRQKALVSQWFVLGMLVLSLMVGHLTTLYTSCCKNCTLKTLQV